MSADFSQRIIDWQLQHGRHQLPWQNTHDPYAIWVSEIMLQQTQVSAVINYYQRFMQRFPTLLSLAEASQDEVLRYWSGLGYYSRARNLHDAAQKIVDEFGAEFPQQMSQVMSLPGIGRSTAAAICAFAFEQTQAILDGNVKRIFARYFLIQGWPGSPVVEKTMWQLAESLLPKHNIIAYTQGLMDLGATLCTRRQPRCGDCPLKQDCQALAQDQVHVLPHSKPKKTLPQKQTVMLIIQDGDEVLLEKRPPSGIWGGLWSLPEMSSQEIASQVVQSRFGLFAQASEPLAEVMHSFTHFKLQIIPQPLQLESPACQMHAPNLIWLPLAEAIGAAIPTPVRNILLHLSQSDETES
jgi:A/G-specific adenine glycosylase